MFYKQYQSEGGVFFEIFEYKNLKVNSLIKNKLYYYSKNSNGILVFLDSYKLSFINYQKPANIRVDLNLPTKDVNFEIKYEDDSLMIHKIADIFYCYKKTGVVYPLFNLSKADGKSYFSYYELNNFNKIGSKIYFNNYEPSTGVELWQTDGTTEGTKIVYDFWAGVSSSKPEPPFQINNKVYCFATTAESGRQLWEIDTIDNKIPDQVLANEPKMIETIAFPNPTNSIINIKTEGNLEIQSTIYDLKGSKILDFRGNSLDISNLKAGVYLLNTISDKGVKTIRIIKE